MHLGESLRTGNKIYDDFQVQLYNSYKDHEGRQKWNMCSMLSHIFFLIICHDSCASTWKLVTNDSLWLLLCGGMDNLNLEWFRWGMNLKFLSDDLNWKMYLITQAICLRVEMKKKTRNN